MKRILTILLLTFNIAHGQSSLLTGKYVSGDNYVLVSDSTLEFKSSYGCCLLVDFYGYGKYRLRGDTIFLTTEKPLNEHLSTFKILNDLPNPFQANLKVECNRRPIQFCNISIKDKYSNRIKFSGFTDSNGVVKIDNFENSILTISFLGYDRLEIPLKDIIGKSILINLLDYEVLSNKEVVFILLRDITSVRLSGPFLLQTKDKVKETKKAQRKRRFRNGNWPILDSDTHTTIHTTFVLE
jgi:hypothetical protein